MTELKNSYCDKTQIVTKIKSWKNQKLKMWQNSNCDKTLKLKLWQNSICDKTWIMTHLHLWEEKKTFKGFFSKSFLTPWQPMRCSLGSVLRFFQCFVVKLDMLALLMTDPARLAPPPCTITPPPLGAFKLKKIKNKKSRVQGGRGGREGVNFPSKF